MSDVMFEYDAPPTPPPKARDDDELPIGAARFTPISFNRKLGKVEFRARAGSRPRPVARRPFVSSTNASIKSSCPRSCAFYENGCFAESGFTKFRALELDKAAAGATPHEVAIVEAEEIRAAFGGGRVPQDGARGGRDLRLHVGGDARTPAAAQELGLAATEWKARGGGSVWTYTHAWRTVPRSAWGPDVSVFASIEHTSEIDEAAARGYPSALVVSYFTIEKALPVRNGWSILPCPAETRGRTCAECRLCLDRDVLALRLVIGFKAHGPQVVAASDALLRVARKKA